MQFFHGRCSFFMDLVRCTRHFQKFIYSANQMIVQSRVEIDGTVVLSVNAQNLTSVNALEFREQANAAIDESTTRVLVDCSQLEFIDSAGVAAFIYTNKLLPESRRPVCLTGVGTKILFTLELMRVHRQFDLEPAK